VGVVHDDEGRDLRSSSELESTHGLTLAAGELKDPPSSSLHRLNGIPLDRLRGSFQVEGDLAVDDDLLEGLRSAVDHGKGELSRFPELTRNEKVRWRLSKQVKEADAP
jgi:hypothetical protein